MAVAQAGERIICTQSGSNFDRHLIERKSGYVVVVFLRVQFFFTADSGGDWLEAEKTSYIADWKSQIIKTWNTTSLTSTSTGKIVPLEFRFQTQIGGWMWDHWEVTVKKIKSGAFATSWVNGAFNSSELDSGDLTLVSKGNGQKQRASVHEFGHMLGLPDEYKTGNSFEKDYVSVMNRGEFVYPRHRAELKKWADNELRYHAIK